MSNPPRTTGVRRAARALAITPAVLVTLAGGAAFAEAPEQWESTPSVSLIHVLLVIVLIPAGLFLLITLLTYLPSMSKGESYRPGEAWRGEPEWFGGPRGGVEGTDQPAAVGTGTGEAGADDPGRGGASGRW